MQGHDLCGGYHHGAGAEGAPVQGRGVIWGQCSELCIALQTLKIITLFK